MKVFQFFSEAKVFCFFAEIKIFQSFSETNIFLVKVAAESKQGKQVKDLKYHWLNHYIQMRVAGNPKDSLNCFDLFKIISA